MIRYISSIWLILEWESASFQSYRIHRHSSKAYGLPWYKEEHLCHQWTAWNKCVLPDLYELVNGTFALSKDCIISHYHVPGHLGVVAHDAVVADDAIAGDMTVSHDEAVVSTFVVHLSLLPRLIVTNSRMVCVIADFNSCLFTFKLEVLRNGRNNSPGNMRQFLPIRAPSRW